MSYFRLIIFYLLFIIKSIISDIIPDCELNSYCGYEKLKCSIYGNCNYDLLGYYDLNSTIGILCECNWGYSSYDIEHNLTTSSGIYCCYKKKSLLISFLLELFIGFGSGHFYYGGNTYGIVKMVIEIFLCVAAGCVTYFSCIREHPFQTNITEVNNVENPGKNIINENKNNENKENDLIDENEEKVNENIIDNKNNESKDESFELEENKENERMFQNFISCPKSKFFIFFSIISYFLFNFIDAILLAFNVFKDEKGEELILYTS